MWVYWGKAFQAERARSTQTVPSEFLEYREAVWMEGRVRGQEVG